MGGGAWQCCGNLAQRLLVNARDVRGPRALKEDGLGLLGAHVSVRRLLVHEGAAKVASGRVHAGHGELGAAAEDLEDLVVLLEETLITASLKRWERNRLVVAGGGAAALGVEEEASAVRGHGHVAGELEPGLDGALGALGDEVLHGEEEGHALTARCLHGRGRIVNAVLLLEDNLAALGDGVALNDGEGVGLASHHLAGDHLGLGGALLVRHLLEDEELLGLEAELVELVELAAQVDVARGGGHIGALVGQASALDLIVRERVVSVLGQSLCAVRGHGGRESGGHRRGCGALNGTRDRSEGRPRGSGLQRVRAGEEGEREADEADEHLEGAD
mmetsp:Transcript_14663/g.35596  ORF Transcript_14663/g.35596 Transcript_14663/m.35596 type:complete len:332 (+) Transcript_14663:254-1249(+)